jgi:hypothetical protein
MRCRTSLANRGASRKRMQFRCASDTMRAAKAGDYPAG